MKCLSCQKQEAQHSAEFGYLPCSDCQKIEIKKPEGFVYEMTTDSIRESRREYRKDIIQPFRGGILSREYLEEFGTTGVQVTEEEVKNAQYTYQDTSGWWDRDKGKGGKNI